MQPVPDRSSNHGFELAVLDIAGTTVEEHGAVYVALEQAVRDAGATPTQEQLHRAMGADKTEAITAMLAPTSDDARVGATYLRFTALLADAYAATPPTPLPGVPEALAALRSAGIKVALTTGFSQDVTATLLAGLGWSVGATVDAVVSAEEVGAGRPAPYMIFEAMRRTGTRDVRRVLVAGDTVLDLEAGSNAGARAVVGVLTGAMSADLLRTTTHTHLLAGVALLPATFL